jgi:predicted ArsR family transcriptional regulator
MPTGPTQESVSVIATLSDPVRRSLFDVVRDAPSPVTREEAAAAVGISRKLATFHLEKLVGVGLLTTQTAPEPRVRGRGGRRPKLYGLADARVEVSIPPRRSDLLASLLLKAVTARGEGEDPAAAVIRISGDHGHAVGRHEREHRRLGRLGAERALTLLRALLERLGYEPTRHEQGLIRFRSCPFEPMSAQAPEVVCRAHHAYVAGMVAGLEASSVEAALLPGTEGCCVEIRPRTSVAATP